MSAKHAELVKSLYSRTEARAVEWVIQGDDKPFTKIGDFFVWLEPARGRGGGAAEKVRLVDPDGKTIDAFTDEDIENENLPHGVRFDTYFALMGRLRKDAIRNARGADKALDQVLKDLNSQL